MILSRPWVIAILALLVLSLAGNLFATGIVVGGQLGIGEGLSGGLYERAVSRFSQGLPPEGQQAVRSAFGAHKAQLLDQVHKLREARHALASLLQAPTIDRPALEQALAHLREETTATQNVFHQVLVDVALAMPASVRSGWWPPIMGKL